MYFCRYFFHIIILTSIISIIETVSIANIHNDANQVKDTILSDSKT